MIAIRLMGKYDDAVRSFLEPHGISYPLWYLAVGDVGGAAAVIAALIVRDSFFPPQWPLLVGLLGLAPDICFYVIGPVFRSSLVKSLSAYAGVMFLTTGLLLLRPSHIQPDPAPLILAPVIASTAACLPPRLSAAFAAVPVAMVVAACSAGALDAAPLYLAMVLICWLAGYIVQGQMRLVFQERAAKAAHAREAAGDERRRIARELHDIVGHSLSITLLHLTGARRALQQDGNVPDAVDALSDAERVGRQAMVDIRRTVGLLHGGPSSTAPEPGVADLDDLVADIVAAGMSVKYTVEGDPAAVSDATGLCLYRIAQESLTNVAKHSPGAYADMRLRVGADTAVLTVRNERAPGNGRGAAGSGSGLRGMRGRAQALGGTLTVAADDRWTIQAEVPVQ